MFSFRFKVENPIYFPFRLKKDLSNMTYGNTDMALHKVSNQRTYKKIFIILHHGNLPIMPGIALTTRQVARGESETNLANRFLLKFTKNYIFG